MYEVEEIEFRLELPIGTRFYFWDHLYEVVESEEGYWCCSKCAFRDEKALCHVMNCNEKIEYDGIYGRKDKKYIYFKEVEEIGEKNNG